MKQNNLSQLAHELIQLDCVHLTVDQVPEGENPYGFKAPIVVRSKKLSQVFDGDIYTWQEAVNEFLRIYPKLVAPKS